MICLTWRLKNNINKTYLNHSIPAWLFLLNYLFVVVVILVSLRVDLNEKDTFTFFVTIRGLLCKFGKLRIKQCITKLPLLLLLVFTGRENVWSDCELEQLGCIWLDCVAYTAGLWTLDNVTILLLICCTWGLWTAPGITVAGVTCWKSCCWPAERQKKKILVKAFNKVFNGT